MFVILKKEALVGCRWCLVDDVIDVDDSRGQGLIEAKAAVEHVGPATVSIEPPDESEAEPADEPADEKSASASDTAPAKKPKPAR